MELPRVLEATDAVTKTVALDQVLGACSMCGRSQWVLSLRGARGLRGWSPR